MDRECQAAPQARDANLPAPTPPIPGGGCGGFSRNLERNSSALTPLLPTVTAQPEGQHFPMCAELQPLQSMWRGPINTCSGSVTGQAPELREAQPSPVGGPHAALPSEGRQRLYYAGQSPCLPMDLEALGRSALFCGVRGRRHRLVFPGSPPYKHPWRMVWNSRQSSLPRKTLRNRGGPWRTISPQSPLVFLCMCTFVFSLKNEDVYCFFYWRF